MTDITDRDIEAHDAELRAPMTHIDWGDPEDSLEARAEHLGEELKDWSGTKSKEEDE